MTSPLPIAVLISGGGTTLRNLITLMQAGELPIEIRTVISSSSTAGGLEFAKNANIACRTIEKRKGVSSAAYGEEIFAVCRESGAELVVMGGFLKHVTIPSDFENRVLNIHPSLIPAFCGRGMYGHFVHDAVLKFGAKVSGCTVHFVDNEYDHGPIVLQRTVPVLDDDSPATLAARVFTVECEALPEAIRLFASGRLRIQEGRVRISSVS